MVDIDKHIDEYNKEIARLERDLTGVQEMLAQVLFAVGEPVIVPKANLKDGLPGVGITIDDHDDSFVFSLVTVTDE